MRDRRVFRAKYIKCEFGVRHATKRTHQPSLDHFLDARKSGRRTTFRSHVPSAITIFKREILPDSNEFSLNERLGVSDHSRDFIPARIKKRARASARVGEPGSLAV